MSNPYQYGNVVSDPNMFFGREDILRKLCTRLENMESTSVVGLRRIGKSSLLCQLARILPSRLGRNYVPLYVDLHDARYRTVTSFVNTVALRVDQKLGGVLGVEAEDTTSHEGIPQQDHLIRLRQILDARFSRDELRTLCFDLDVDYENLPGECKASKARELVIYLERRGRISHLVKLGAQKRPNEVWEDTPKAAGGLPASFQNGPLGRVRGFLRPKRSRSRLTLGTVTDMVSFSEMLDILDDTDIRPVLCLDEFEEFTRHPKEFSDDFVEPLRSLGAHSKLAMVTASRRPLIDLVKGGQLTSPFYNIFAQTELGLLGYDAARELRRIPFERDNIVLSPEHEALVEELGGRHPFFLQMACHHLFETFPGPRDKWTDFVQERFSHDAEPHFDQLRDYLSDGEPAALGVVVGQDSLSDETEAALKRLERLGVVERRDGKWQLFSQAFAKHMRRYLPQERRNVLQWLRERVKRS